MGGEGEVGYGGFGGWVERSWGEVYPIDTLSHYLGFKTLLKREMKDTAMYTDLGDIYSWWALKILLFAFRVICGLP